VDRASIRISVEPPDDPAFRRALDAAIAAALLTGPDAGLAERVEAALRTTYPLTSVEPDANDPTIWTVRRTGELGNGGR
jgi:hypothetical protein